MTKEDYEKLGVLQGFRNPSDEEHDDVLSFMLYTFNRHKTMYNVLLVMFLIMAICFLGEVLGAKEIKQVVGNIFFTIIFSLVSFAMWRCGKSEKEEYKMYESKNYTVINPEIWYFYTLPQSTSFCSVKLIDELGNKSDGNIFLDDYTGRRFKDGLEYGKLILAKFESKGSVHYQLISEAQVERSRKGKR